MFITSRTDESREITEDFLRKNGIHYDHIIFNAPYGERILFNDDKPSGLRMGVALNKKRDEEVKVDLVEDKTL